MFFANQLAIHHEQQFFHWITARAIDVLIGEGVVKTETRKLSSGSEIKLLWHRSHRYYKRDAKRVVQLVEEYGSPNICAALGLQAEALVLEGFARREFLLRRRHASEFGGRKWTRTGHNLDFIFERDGRAYGVEVKNTLSYMKQSELITKIEMCDYLGIIPVFAVRMLPKSLDQRCRPSGRIRDDHAVSVLPLESSSPREGCGEGAGPSRRYAEVAGRGYDGPVPCLAREKCVNFELNSHRRCSKTRRLSNLAATSMNTFWVLTTRAMRELSGGPKSIHRGWSLGRGLRGLIALCLLSFFPWIGMSERFV